MVRTAEAFGPETETPRRRQPDGATFRTSDNGQQGSRTTAGQQVHAVLADQYRRAAARNADAGRKLGGSQGFALISLAEHFARRAQQHALAAGAAR